MWRQSSRLARKSIIRWLNTIGALEARNREAIQGKLAYTDFLVSARLDRLRHDAYCLVLDGKP